MEGVQLITRKRWGARRPKETTPLPVSQARGCAIHYSASRSPLEHRDCAPAVRAIQRFHMDTQGWNDIAYSWIGCRHGYIFRGRGLGVRTAANGTNHANSRFYAYCFLGRDNVNRRDVTPEAKNTLLHLLVWLNRQIPGPMQVCPHSAFTATSCPGDELRALLAATGWQCKE